MFKQPTIKTIFILLLISGCIRLYGAEIRFVAVVYDMVTYQPVAGKTVEFDLFSLTFSQTLFQQQYTTSFNGEIVTQSYPVADTTLNVYRFRLNDCNSNVVEFTDTFMSSGIDTMVLFLGICHSVPPGLCKAGFFWNADTANPLIINFQDTSTGNAVTYSWSFGDGTVSGLQHPVKQYTGPGTYLVSLTITDTVTNCINTCFDVVSITQGVSVTADFTSVLDSFSVAPRIVGFSNESGSNVWLNQYFWAFGDGQVSQVMSPVHQYLQSGQYEVCLKAGYAGGLYDTICKTITIPEYHDMWGQLFYEGKPLDGGRVDLINPLSKDSGYTVLDEVAVVSPGFYFFAERIEHNYLLRAFPDSANAMVLIPTYNGNTIFWKKAALVPLFNDITNLDISFVKKDDPGSGTCIVNGNVWYSIDKPAARSLILLLDYVTMQPVAFTYSDPGGGYSIPQLPYGKYRLVAEVPGLESSETVIEFSVQNTTMTGMDIYLSKTISVNNNSLKSSDIKVFPNPARDVVFIEFSGPGDPGDIIIYNTSGREMLSRTEYSQDKFHHKVDISTLPAGLYFIEMRTEKGTMVRKFVKGE